MSEENKQNAQAQAESKPIIPEITNDMVRNHPLFLKLAKDLGEKNAAEENARKSAEEARLKAAGDYESLKTKLETEAQAKIDAAERKARDAEIKALVASIPNERNRKSVLWDMQNILEPGTDLAKYIDDLRVKEPALFAAGAAPLFSGQQQGGRSNNGDSAIDWKAVNTAANSGTPQQVIQALNQIGAYTSEHGGNMPPGVALVRK